jgi:hypothetical protein
MANGMICLDRVTDGIEEIAGLGSELSRAISNGEQSPSTRDGAIRTINEMCDGLQLAADLISKELSAGISEFNRVHQQKEEILRGYFERMAVRFSEPSLRLLLYEGTACEQLHKLGDRFEQPSSKEAAAGPILWQDVKTFLARSHHMLTVLHGLIEGERDYLRGFSHFLEEARERAEAAAQLPWGDGPALRTCGHELVQSMRGRRAILQAKLTEMRLAADMAIAALSEAHPRQNDRGGFHQPPAVR